LLFQKARKIENKTKYSSLFMITIGKSAFNIAFHRKNTPKHPPPTAKNFTINNISNVEIAHWIESYPSTASITHGI